MKNVGTHLYKYKFNYLVKFFFGYQLLKEMQNSRYIHSIAFQSMDSIVLNSAAVAWNATLCAAVFLYF